MGARHRIMNIAVMSSRTMGLLLLNIGLCNKNILLTPVRKKGLDF